MIFNRCDALGMKNLILSTVLLMAASANALATSDGAALYQQNCASCHGGNLEGQPNWKQRKPDGKLPAPPHDASGHTWHHSDQQNLDITKLGIEALVSGYKSDMIGFGDKLSDDEIWAILDYIKSTWPEEIRARRKANGLDRPEG